MRSLNVLLISALFVIIALIIGAVSYLGIVRPYLKYTQAEKNIQTIHSAFDKKDYSKVIDLSDAYLQTYPENSDILLLKSFALFNFAYLSAPTPDLVDLNMIWDSIRIIRKALVIGISPSMQGISSYILGKNYYLLSGQHLYTAINYLSDSINKGYDANDTYEFLSAAMLETNQVDQAILLLKDRIEHSTAFSNYLLLLDIYLDQQQVDNATQLLTEGESIAHTELEKIAFQIREARIMLLLKDLTQAENILSDIIELYPKSIEAHFYLGNVYEQLGDISKARFEWRKAYKMSPYWNKVIAKLDQEVNQ